MIDPSDVIKFDRSDDELFEWFLFSATVAGKTASTIARLLEEFLAGMPGEGPIEKVRQAVALGTLGEHLRRARLGQYTKLEKCFSEVLHLDLRTCIIDELEGVTGIGPKTARMFLMHSRPDQRLAALDVHVLKHLNASGIPAPATTPTAGKKYRMLESEFLKLADAANMNAADYDLMIWKQYSRSYKVA